MALPPADLFLSGEELRRLLEARSHVALADFAELGDGNSLAVTTGSHTLLKQTLELERRKGGLLAPLARTIAEWLENRERVVIACRSYRQAEQLASFFKEHDFAVRLAEPPLAAADPAAGVLTLYGLPLSAGFDLPAEQLHFVSETELFGTKRLGRAFREKPRRTGPTVSFDELQTGDVIVHRDHGLGIYQGLVNLTINGITNDFLLLVYQGEDRLYVPVDRLNLVHKYKGLDDSAPKIDKLGGKSWATTKKRVKDAVWKVAHELLDIYAKRAMRKGHAFSLPDDLYREFEESFAYNETAGQQKAIDEVLADLTREEPMDRLLCGDVGYGKTEVAMRAAFKVLEDGHQVAVLVPTTVLAEQHARTFGERFNGFPVRVESLNRFRSAAEQKRITSELAEGRVDLVIGTHRLLGKDVSFKRLGLLIVDEEHRFGVAHKERLKKMKAEVDVLTLTATPIPRTLQMSLLGIRDLSVISTPPERRQAIKTFVSRYDTLVVKEAVVRELQRAGQVFFVHNRVQTIHEMAATVQGLVPEARIAVAHGQLPAAHLEEIMVRFIRHEIDVLVCTTIIESGLDIPNANTIIVNRADRLGLAEIYQLRGRVGRSSGQAYAYLLVPSLEELSEDAQKRLRALTEYSELGGGFKLAMSDLQIRGGGNLLGVSQSGHIAAVGYDLYLDLLAKTVEDLKRKQITGELDEREEVEPELSLRLSAYIPESYIGDLDQRYLAYRRMASIASIDDILELKEELRDRYGSPPEEVRNLFEVMALKPDLRRLRIKKVEQGDKALVFHFDKDAAVDPEKILGMVKKGKPKSRFTPDGRLIVEMAAGSAAEVLAGVKKILHGLM